MVSLSKGRKELENAVSPQRTITEIIYILLLFFAAVLPLIVAPYIFEDVFDLPKVTFLRLIALFVASLWLVSAVYGGRITWTRTPINIPLILFFLVAVAATALSFNAANSLAGTSFKRHEALPTWIAYFIFFFAACNFFKEPRRIHNLVKIVVATSIIISIYGIFQHFGYELFNYKVANIDRFRSFATFGNAVFLGGYLTLILPIAFSLTVWEENSKIKAIWLGAATLSLITLVFTYTRGAWVGAIFGLAFWLYLVLIKGTFLRNSLKRWIFFLLVSLFLIIVLVAAVEKVFPIDISLGERVVSAFQLKGSVASRLSIWRSTIHEISVRPLLGWGPETQRLVSPKFREEFFVELEGANKIPDRPHNQLLNIAYSFGLFGVFCYIWLLISYFSYSLLRSKQIKQRDYLVFIGILAGSLGYIIQEQFAFSVVGVTPFFWLLMGANLSFLLKNDKSRSYIIRMRSWLRILSIVVVVLSFLVGVFFIFRFLIADFYYYKGIKTSQKGDTMRATLYFNQAAIYNSYEAKYIFAYGEGAKSVALATGNLTWLDTSVSLYQRSLAYSQYDYDLLFGLGNAYFVKAFMQGTKDYTQAREAYSKAVEYEPYFAEAYAWLGRSYLAEGKLELALKNLNRANELSPQNIAALDALARIYEREGDTSRALSYFRKILDTNPNYQPAIQGVQRLGGLP